MKFTEINIKVLSKSIFDSFVKKHPDLKLRLYNTNNEGSQFFIENRTDMYYSLYLGINKGYKGSFIIISTGCFIYFDELSKTLIPLLKKHNFFTDSKQYKNGLLTLTNSTFNSGFIGSYQVFSESYQTQKLRFYRFEIKNEEDIETFSSFLDDYYKAEVLPFVNAFSSLEKLFNFLVEHPNFSDLDLRLPFHSRMVIYKKFNENFYQEYYKEYLDRIEGAEKKDFDLIACTKELDQVLSGQIAQNIPESEEEKQVFQKLIESISSFSVCLEIENDNPYTAVVESFLGLFSEYFQPYNIIEDTEHESIAVVLSFEERGTIYTFNAKDKGKYLDEDILVFLRDIVYKNGSPYKLYMEVEHDIENFDGIIRLHKAKPEELGKLSTEINKELIEYENYY